jgi:nucleoid DNA-binding protein
MNQSIGISYEATGQDKIINAFERIDKELGRFLQRFEHLDNVLARASGLFDRLTSKAAALGGALGRSLGVERFAAEFSGASRSVSALNTDLASTSRLVGKVSSELNAAASSARRFQSAVHSGGSPGAAGGYGPPGRWGRGGADNAVMPWGMGLPGFWLRWQLWSGAAQAARYGAVDIGMGRNRVELDERLAELNAVGFNRMQKQATEEAAHKWAERFGYMKPTDYIQAMSQTASAFSVDKIGMANMQKMNEAALVMGKLGKMSGEASAELLSKQLNSYLAAQPASVYNALQSGGRANVRGFGNVDLGEMAQRYAAMTSKSIEISNIWGKGISDFMQYAGPVMAQQGWDPSAMLAYAGTMVDVGFKGAKSGRAMKDVMVRAPENYARLMMASEGRMTIGATGRAKEAQEEEVRQRSAQIRQIMQDPEKFADFLGKAVAPAMQHAQRLSTDPKYALNLVKDFGMSRDFLPQMLALAQPGTVERIKHQLAEIRGATFAEAMEKVEEATDTVGHQWTKVTASAQRWAASISKSKGLISEALGGVASFFSSMSDTMDKTNLINAGLEDLRKRQRPPRDEGWFVQPGQENKYMSTLEMREKIQSMMDEHYRRREAELKKPGADATDEEREAYAKSKAQLWNETLQMGRDWWGQTQVQKDVEKMISDKNFAFPQALSNAADAVQAFASRIWESVKQVSPVGVPTPAQQEKAPENVMPQSQAGDGLQGRQWDPERGDWVRPMSGEGSQPQINIQTKVMVGDREIRDIVQEAIADHQMSKRAYMGV